MIAQSLRRMLVLCLLALSALALPTTASAKILPDLMQAGADRAGQPCTVNRDWARSKGVIKSASVQPFVITCRGASAAKVVGVVAPAMYDAALPEKRDCGAAGHIAIVGLGTVPARMCRDPQLGIEVVELRVASPRGGFVGTASTQAVLPMVRLLKALVSGTEIGADVNWQPAVELSGLAESPARTAKLGKLSDFSLEGALRQGVLFIRAGENVSASRVLNDALSRVDASTPTATTIELQLSAALADSGLGQFDAASDEFDNAQIALDHNRSMEQSAYLGSALRTYRGLDAVNRRDWHEALNVLNATADNTSPLADPITLSKLNRDTSNSRRQTGLSVSDKTQYHWLELEVQQRYARSVALLGLNRIGDSQEALVGKNGAVASFQALELLVRPESINWMRARLQLQYARTAERAGQHEVALTAYDCTIRTMEGVAGSAECPVALKDTSSLSSDSADAAAIASIQMERASVASKSGSVFDQTVSNNYRDAIETLINSGRSNNSQPPALIGYFNLLLRQSADHPSTEINEQYFRAMQAVGDPAIASDMARLENVVASDGSVGTKLRDRLDLDRRITQLRYQISALPEADTVGRAELEQQRADAESLKGSIENELQKDPRYRSQDDHPIKLAELQGILLPGEVYLKLVKIRSRFFGMAATASNSWIYSVDAPSVSIEHFSEVVINSARSQYQRDGSRKLFPFDVETSYALFRAITGPAADTVAKAQAVVFDPAGQLRNFPAGILVTSAESVKTYNATRNAAPLNLSKVSFLAGKVRLATAFSPKSFLIVRSRVVPSDARLPWLGLGENATSPVEIGAAGLRPIIQGNGCSINYATWAGIKNANLPISAAQLHLIADAFGVPGAPMMIGAAFSDVGIEEADASGELQNYQVLHFATHGLPQLPINVDGCKTDLPPALVTTMVPPPVDGPIVSNGLLSYDKIAVLHLNANLVVLSACETFSGTTVQAGRLGGQEDSSQGTLDGLVRAFITANARAVLATYWRVPVINQNDSLMATFYRTGRNTSIGEALATAQRALMHQPKYSHPYYWGAYFVVGDTAKPMLTGTKLTLAEPGLAHSRVLN